MKKVLIFSALFLLASVSLSAQVVKGAGLWYFNGLPNVTPSVATGTEVAYSINNKSLFKWNRTTSAWVAVVQDSSITNELQDLILSGDTLSLTLSGSVILMAQYRNHVWEITNLSDTTSITGDIEGDIAYTSTGDTIAFRGASAWLPFTGGGGGGTFNSFNIAGDTGSDIVTDGQTVTIAGGYGINTAETGGTVTVTADTSQLATQSDISGFGTMSSFTVAAGSGTPQTITNGNTVTIAAGTGITTTAGATDQVTVAISSDSTAAWVSGTGTNLRIPRFTGANSIGNSTLLQSSTGVGLDANLAFQITGGTTASRPTGAAGMMYYNTSNNWFDLHNGTSWFNPLRSATATGLGTADYVFFSDANGLATGNAGLRFITSPRPYIQYGQNVTLTTTGGYSFISENTNSRTITNSSGSSINSIVSAFRTIAVAAGANNFGSFVGSYAQVTAAAGHAAGSALLGALGYATCAATTGAPASLTGGNFQADNASTGGATKVVAVELLARHQATGTVSNLYGMLVSTNNTGGGTISNTYGIRIGDVTAGTQTNQAYSIYAEDINARNYFGGILGIGVTAPALTLDVRSTSANTTGVFSLANTTVTTPLKQFVTNATPQSSITGSPGDIAFSNAGIAYLKETGSATNTGWVKISTATDLGAYLPLTLTGATTVNTAGNQLNFLSSGSLDGVFKSSLATSVSNIFIDNNSNNGVRLRQYGSTATGTMLGGAVNRANNGGLFKSGGSNLMVIDVVTDDPLYIGGANGIAVTVGNGTTRSLRVHGTAQIDSTDNGNATEIAGYTSGKLLTKVTPGAGIDLTSGEIRATQSFFNSYDDQINLTGVTTTADTIRPASNTKSNDWSYGPTTYTHTYTGTASRYFSISVSAQVESPNCCHKAFIEVYKNGTVTSAKTQNYITDATAAVTLHGQSIVLLSTGDTINAKFYGSEIGGEDYDILNYSLIVIQL